MFNIYIKKVAEMNGLPGTREIYEKAIEALPEEHMRQICVRFAEMETKLGEIDRARAIYAHCSQVKVYLLKKKIEIDFYLHFYERSATRASLLIFGKLGKSLKCAMATRT